VAHEHTDGSEAVGRRRLWEVTALALKLGFTAFGVPAAHIAMLHDEVVKRRRWITEAHFLDLLGATNLIPGPNSTEMVIHVGQARAGWRGLIAAGVAFILPAAGIVLALAWAYTRYGTTPAAEWLLYGIKPVIIAVVAQALWNLGRTALKGPLLLAVGAAALGLYLLGVNELAPRKRAQSAPYCPGCPRRSSGRWRRRPWI
jgi:chromate transporter